MRYRYEKSFSVQGQNVKDNNRRKLETVEMDVFRRQRNKTTNGDKETLTTDIERIKLICCSQ